MVLKEILEFLVILDEFKFRNSKIPYRDPQVKLGDDIVGNFEFLEIAPSALLPRNDGIFEFSVMSSPRGLGDDRKSDPQKGKSS